jgi:hypothetical protein
VNAARIASWSVARMKRKRHTKRSMS